MLGISEESEKLIALGRMAGKTDHCFCVSNFSLKKNYDFGSMFII